MDDLSDALELTSDDFNEDEKILKGIVNFGNINVSAIMCSRIDVTAIDIKSGFDKIVPVIIRFRIFKNSCLFRFIRYCKGNFICKRCSSIYK